MVAGRVAIHNIQFRDRCRVTIRGGESRARSPEQPNASFAHNTLIPLLNQPNSLVNTHPDYDLDDDHNNNG